MTTEIEIIKNFDYFNSNYGHYFNNIINKNIKTNEFNKVVK